MSSFSGFSDADILKLQNGEVLTNILGQEQSTVTSETYYSAMPMNTNKQSKKDMRMKVVFGNKFNASQKTDLPDTAKLINLSLSSQSGEDNLIIRQLNDSIDDKKIEAIKIFIDTSKSQEPQVSTTLTAADGTEKKCIDLDEFKLKQKYMEEQNRMRKEQVARALEDRTKQTQQEQQKLVAIQDEFKKLDATLSNDVKILRKQIETASYDYMDAQKRYHKIEKEFLGAKLYLHQTLEKKEMLTEHLCAIIEKNEERKADKLNELLKKLEILDAGTENGKIQAAEITSND